MKTTAIYDGETVAIEDVVSFARSNEADALVENGLTIDRLGEEEFNLRVAEGVRENAGYYADQYRVTVAEWLAAVKW